MLEVLWAEFPRRPNSYYHSQIYSFLEDYNFICSRMDKKSSSIPQPLFHLYLFLFSLFRLLKAGFGKWERGRRQAFYVAYRVSDIRGFWRKQKVKKRNTVCYCRLRFCYFKINSHVYVYFIIWRTFPYNIHNSFFILMYTGFKNLLI